MSCDICGHPFGLAVCGCVRPVAVGHKSEPAPGPEHFYVGDQVVKKSGYLWPGVVVSIFTTMRGETRYVVECTVPEVAGALHIYNGNQITKRVA